MIYIKRILVLIIIITIPVHSFVFADTNTQEKDRVQKQENLVTDLSKDVEKFQTEHDDILSGSIKKLSEGDTGDEVEAVQTLLSLDPEVYPEGLITGTFGKKTREAVKRFQEKNGLAKVGNVGPETLKKLKQFAHDNALTAENDEKDWNHNGKHEKRKTKRICVVIPTEHFISSRFGKVWERREKEIREGKNDTGHGKKATQIPRCKNTPKTIDDGLGNITPPPDTTDHTAPLIVTPVSTSGITGTSATVTWDTNENAKSTVWYGQTNPVIKESASVVENNNFSTSHSVVINSLSPHTVYYFIISATDASDNSTLSTQGTFSTIVDIIPPVISDVQTTNMSGAETNIVWNTDKDTTDKIWISTTPPVNTSGVPFRTNNNLYDSHEFELTTLFPHTTYYYAISSADSSGNTTTAQGSFTTQ